MNLNSTILELEEFIEDSTGEIDLNIKYKYLILKKSDLVRVMNICNKMILSKSNEIEYSSISLVPVLHDKSVLLYTTNELSQFRYRTELIGDTNEMINEPLSVSFSVLQKIVKLMANKVMFYIKDNNIYVRLLDGDLLLDYRKPRLDVLNFPGNPTDKIAELSLSNVGELINKVYTLIENEPVLDKRKLNFLGDKCYFNSTYYYIESDITTPRLSLSVRDLDIIKKLYKYYKDNKIQLFNFDSSVSRLFIKLDNIEYISVLSSVSNIFSLTQELQDRINETKFSLDYNKLYRIINLANTLPGNSGDLNLSLDDKLTIEIKSNNGSSSFNLDVKYINNKNLTYFLSIKSEVLRKALIPFEGSNEIELSVSESGMIISNNKIKSILTCLL